MAGRENAMLGAVAVNACGCRRRSTGWLGMHAVRIRVLSGGMAIGAGHFGRRLVVHKAFHVFVAIDAAQHLAVNGVLELILVDKET